MAIGSNAFSQTLITAQAAGTAVANTATSTTLLPTPAIYTIPANGLAYIGQSLKVRAWGKFSTTATPTLRFDIYIAGASVWNSGTITSASGATNLPFEIDLNMTVQTLGSGTAATLAVQGVVSGVGGATTQSLVPASAPGNSSGFNSTQANTFDLQVTWGTSSASNTIQLLQYELMSPN